MGTELEPISSNYEYQSEYLEQCLPNKNTYSHSKTEKKEPIKKKIPEICAKTKRKNTFNDLQKNPIIEENQRKFSDSAKNINEKIKEIFYDSNKNSSNLSDFSINTSSSSLGNIAFQSSKNHSSTNLKLNKSNSDDIRKSFMAKLIYKNIWNKSQTHNSIIIFDWDDTLLPTTYLTKEKLMEEEIIPETEKEKLAKLEKTVIKILNLAMSKGEVYIITNSGMGWVESSANKFYPILSGLLKKINIISARNEYEDAYPGNAKEWKVHSFLSLKDKVNEKLVTNILCLGDSLFEIEAGKILASNFMEAFIKTVKFRDTPRPGELNKQLNLIIDQFNYIYSSAKNLTIRVGKKN